MIGLELPILAMEHVSHHEDMREVKAWNDKTGTEIIHAIDFDSELYLRQARGGMLMGTYEKAGPLEARLERFVAYNKPADFIGKQGALGEKQSGGKLRLRAFVVNAVDADVIGDEPIWHCGRVQGWVTSGGYAHNAKSLWRSATCRRKSPMKARVRDRIPRPPP